MEEYTEMLIGAGAMMALIIPLDIHYHRLERASAHNQEQELRKLSGSAEYYKFIEDHKPTGPGKYLLGEWMSYNKSLSIEIEICKNMQT